MRDKFHVYVNFSSSIVENIYPEISLNPTEGSKRRADPDRTELRPTLASYQ